MECKSRRSTGKWSNKKVCLGVQNEAGQRLTEFGQEKALLIPNTLRGDSTPGHHYMVNSKTILTIFLMGFPGGSEDKASTCNAGDPSSIPGLQRSPGEGNGNPLQYSYLKNPMDRGPWQGAVHRVTQSQTRLK